MAERPPINLAVLVSGSGTNLQAIIDAIARGELSARIRVVISNRPQAFGLERARKAGIATHVIEHRKFPTREDFDRAILAVLEPLSIDLIACAGFMRILSPVMLAAYPDRVMNIHPSLLPAFPGTHAQRDALAYGVRVAGCSVFFVAAGVDDGPIIAQAAVPVLPEDDEERLGARILEQEHRIYPLAIRLFQQGRLEISGRRVLIRDYPGSAADRAAIINPRPR